MPDATLEIGEPMADNAQENGNGHAAAVPQPHYSSSHERLEPLALSIPWSERNLNAEQTNGLILNHAVQSGASDIFFATTDADVAVTFRHLGLIRPVARLPLDLGGRCISHLRTMAHMKYAERRIPLDGRWAFSTGQGQTLDIRMNALPTLHGECIALRMLSRSSQLRKFDSLGFVGPQLGLVTSALAANTGLVLLTGPTGSGKTTTAYACLHALNNGHRKIHTIEDPVEYAVTGLHQTQVDAEHGADFAEMLRGVIRQGPDVIVVGEVRDKETAETAVRAANSGQLVFASLHAAVAATAIQSILNLGVSSYFLCTSLLAVICQRLVRTLAPDRRVPIDMSMASEAFDDIRPWLEPGQGTTVYAASTDGDDLSAYTGRTGIFEVMLISSALRRLVMNMRPASEIHAQALEEGMLDFRRAGLLKVAQGITTFDEIQRMLPTGDAWMEEN